MSRRRAGWAASAGGALRWTRRGEGGGRFGAGRQKASEQAADGEQALRGRRRIGSGPGKGLAKLKDVWDASSIYSLRHADSWPSRTPLKVRH